MRLLAAAHPPARRAIFTLAVIIVSAAAMGACAPHDPNQRQDNHATVDEIVAEINTAYPPERLDLDQQQTYAPHLKWSFDNTAASRKDETTYSAALPYDHRATITQKAGHFTIRIMGPGPGLHEAQAHNADAAGAAVAEWLRLYEHSQSRRTATMRLIDAGFEAAYQEWQPPTADATGRPYSRRSE